MRLNWKSALGIALSAGLLVWTLRNESPAEIWSVISNSNLPLLALAALIATSIFPLRAIRWQLILDPLAPKLPLGALWRSIAIGMMVNNIYPARLGEVARAYALTRETKRVSLTGAVASLAVDRVFDALTLVLLLVGAMLVPDFPKGMTVGGQPVQRGAILFATGAVAMFVILYLIVAIPERLVSLYATVVGRFAPRLVKRGSEIIRTFSEGLGVLRSPRRFIAVFFWALVHWLVNALAFWLGFKAVGIDVPFSAANFLQGIIAIGVALPSSPGFFGVFEVAATVGLAVYGVPRREAVSWAIGFHVLSFIPITVIGLYYFARLGLHFSDFQTPAEKPGVERSTGGAT
jgi:glycosyltransferase 2 family protein